MNYEYDEFGNRYQKQASNSTSLAYVAIEDSHLDKSTNRFNTGLGITYDDAGNITTDSRFTARQYIYDANNRQRQIAQVNGTGASTSVYDGTGQRVATMAATSVDNVLVYDAGGKLVAEYGQTSVNRGTSYVFTDHQSSTRVVMDSSGTVTSRHDYQAYGGEIGAGVGQRATAQKYGQGDSARQKYAGMEQDDGSSNSHTLWRKYDATSGRWTSPDPYNGSMTIADPQTFNRYSYVNNDPVNQVDASGLMPRTGADVGWSGFEGFGGGFDINMRRFGGIDVIHDRLGKVDDQIEKSINKDLKKSEHAGWDDPPDDIDYGDPLVINTFAFSSRGELEAFLSSYGITPTFITCAGCFRQRLPDAIQVSYNLLFWQQTFTLDSYGNVYVTRRDIGTFGTPGFKSGVGLLTKIKQVANRLLTPSIVGGTAQVVYVTQGTVPSEETSRAIFSGQSITIQGAIKGASGSVSLDTNGNPITVGLGVSSNVVGISTGYADRWGPKAVGWRGWHPLPF
jgi:RHS repeat-associated protein